VAKEAERILPHRTEKVFVQCGLLQTGSANTNRPEQNAFSDF
jgi:hypothetical protein